MNAGIQDGASELHLMPIPPGVSLKSPLHIQRRTKGAWDNLNIGPIPGFLYVLIMRRFKILAKANPFSLKGIQEGGFGVYYSESEDGTAKSYLVHASFPETPEGIVTALTLREASA